MRRLSTPLSLALTYLGLTATVCVAAAVAALHAGPLGTILLVYSYPFLGALYAAAGLLAWARRPVNRLGPLLVFAGGAWVLGGLQNTGTPLLIATGKLSATFALSVIIHLLHACPSGRLRDGRARAVVAAGYFVGVALEAPLWMFGPEPPPFDVVMISARPDLAQLGKHVQEYSGLAVVLVTLMLLAQRLRDFDPRQRRLFAPLIGYTLVALVAIPIGSDLLEPIIGLKPTFAIQTGIYALVPVGFVLVLLCGGFARTTEIGALVTSVASRPGVPGDLQSAVARTLGDPSATVLRWSAVREEYVDPAGVPATLPADRSLYASVPVMIGDRRLGALVYDTQLTVDPALPAAVARVAAIALDREQLAAEAERNGEALQQASARLLDESDRTRRQIAQDLHDGLQGTLVALSMQAHLIAEDAADPATAPRAAGLAAQVDRAAATLRALVQGVMPPQLLERGLAAAVQELAYSLPVRVRVDAAALPQLPAAVESTAYFVVAEALTNVVKHADASLAEVGLRLSDQTLHVVISDDGVGGAEITGIGLGLAGLHDRVRVLGGELTMTSGPEGTRLEAELPCGS